MAFIAARISVLRGRPPGEAGGISGASRAHFGIPQVAREPFPVTPINPPVLLRPHRRPPSGETPPPVNHPATPIATTFWVKL